MSRPLSSLNLLRVFESAARHGSFKLAGDELCVTASAVSQQIRQLEEQLGLALFQRHARGLSLTDEGQRYAADIRPLLAAIDEATMRLQAGRRQLLRVTLMPPLARRVVLPRLASFQSRHPDIDLRLDTSLHMLDLAQRQADLAIRYGNPPWLGCVHHKLADLSIQPICPPAVATQLDLLQHPERLAQAPRVHMTGRPDSWPLYFAGTGNSPATPVREFFVDDYPAAIEAAESLGAVLALLPLEKPLIDSGRVVAVGSPLPLPDAMYAVMLEERRNDPVPALFLEWLREQLDTL